MSQRVLAPFQRRFQGVTLLQGLALGVFLLGAASLAAVLGDALTDWPDGWRAAVPGGLIALGLIIIAVTAWQLHRLTTARLARLLETRHNELGNRLSNAVALEPLTGTTPAQEFLRLEAVALGQNAASTVAAWPICRKTFAVIFSLTLLTGIGWGVLIALQPEVWQAERPRFLDPRGDHPPFSRLKIEVTPKEASVLFGGEVEVHATLSGRAAEKLWLVAQTDNKETRSLMFLAPNRSYFQSLANLREPATFYVTDGRARSHRHPISIRYTPQITLVELTTEFPAYTDKPAKTGKLSDEVQALPAGSKVTFRVASNRPLKNGDLLLTPVLGGKPTTVTLEPESQNTLVHGSFTLKEAVVFSLSVRDTNDLASAQTRQGRFNILPDLPPRLNVLEPGRDAVATPEIRIPVHVQAQDDYGVTKVVWLRGHNRSIEQPFEMKLDLKDKARTVETLGAFDLGKLGVRPGDVIDYYFEAVDNDPLGPNVTVSRMYHLQIISKKQYAAIVRNSEARQALFEPYLAMTPWLKRLAERARNLDARSRNATDAEKQAIAQESEALAKELEQYQKALGELLSKTISFDVEESFRKTLVEQHSRLSQALQDFKSGGGRDNSPTQDQLDALEKELEALAKTSEEDIEQPARQIASVANLLSRADLFARLSQEQDRVAKMLERYMNREEALSRVEQMEVRELTRRQQRIQEELHSLMQSLPDLMGKLPPDAEYDPLREQVTQFINAVNDAKIEQDVADAAKGLSELDMVAGGVMAREAARKMDALVSKCNSIGEQGQQCLSFKPSISLGNSLQQILAAMGVGKKTGSGQGGQDGYSLFNNDVGIYGPGMERPGQPAGKRGGSGRGAAQGSQQVASDAADPLLNKPDATTRLRLQPDAKFPLRYRDLVGEYFRTIAESEDKP